MDQQMNMLRTDEKKRSAGKEFFSCARTPEWVQ